MSTEGCLARKILLLDETCNFSKEKHDSLKVIIVSDFFLES